MTRCELAWLEHLVEAPLCGAPELDEQHA
jgi:hypothetical protein